MNSITIKLGGNIFKFKLSSFSRQLVKSGRFSISHNRVRNSTVMFISDVNKFHLGSIYITKKNIDIYSNFVSTRPNGAQMRIKRNKKEFYDITDCFLSILELEDFLDN